jgi:alpha-1,6-mannosyltransferase
MAGPSTVADPARALGWSRARRLGLLGSSVIASVVLLTVGARHSSASVTLTLVAAGCAGVLAWYEWRQPVLGVHVVVGAIAVVFVVAVLAPSNSSNDLWSYTMYGRMVVTHGVSPYTHAPRNFPGDPFLVRVSPMWRGRASVFGPLWTGWSSLGALVAGTSTLAARLYFQLTAAAVATATLVFVWRRTGSTAALIWLGLQPAFGAVAINGGHSDLVIGLALLVAALALGGRRAAWAGVLIGAAVLVKITAALALVGAVLWLWHRSRLRDAAITVGVCAVTVAAGYAAFLGDATRVLRGADHTVTVGAPWNGIADLVLQSDAGRAWRHPLAPNSFLDVVWVSGTVTVVVVALVAGWCVARRRRDPRESIGVTTAAYTMGAAYSFPWYAAWALPNLADGEPSPVAWVVWLQATVMLAALKLASHPNGTVGDIVFRYPLTYLAPPLLLVAFVVVACRRDPTERHVQSGGQSSTQSGAHSGAQAAPSPRIGGS